MVVAEARGTRRNGTGAPMPVQTVDVDLQEIGYPGWYVRMRINPRTSTYNTLSTYGAYDVPSEDDDPSSIAKAHVEHDRRWWKAFAQVVVEWNLEDEDGHRLPHPREVDCEKDLDLPIKLHTYVLNNYFKAVWAETELPKAPSDNSAPTSSTSEGSPRSD